MGNLVYSNNNIEVYQTLSPSGSWWSTSVYYWKAIGTDKMHGPFNSLVQAHVHYDAFMQAKGAPDCPLVILPPPIPIQPASNVIRVEFRLRKRVG